MNNHTIKKEMDPAGAEYNANYYNNGQPNQMGNEQIFFTSQIPPKIEKKPDTFNFNFAKGSAPVVTIQNQ
ncbi:unnamed protein product [Caenorhabditis nigoni]